VQPHTLINLLQDGMWFDKLQAEAANVRALRQTPDGNEIKTR
jgi:hypothetical protein